MAMFDDMGDPPPQGFDPTQAFSIFDPSQPFTLGDDTPAGYSRDASGHLTKLQPNDKSRLPSAPVSAEDFTHNKGGAKPDSQMGFVDAAKQFLTHTYNSSPIAAAKQVMDLWPGNPDFVKNTLGVDEAMAKEATAHMDAAKKSWGDGKYYDALGHALTAILPVVGPAANQLGEEVGGGNYAAAAGDVTGMLSGAGLEEGIRRAPAALDAFAASPAGTATANLADRIANNKMARVLVPDRGARRAQLGASVAPFVPDLLRDQVTVPGQTVEPTPNMGAATVPGLRDKISEARDQAAGDLRDAYNAVPEDANFKLQPVVDGVRKKLNDLLVSGTKTVDAQTVSGWSDAQKKAFTDAGGKIDPSGTATGSTQIAPVNRSGRIGAINQALQELDGLGDSVNMDNLYNLAKAWNEGAKKVYTSKVAPGADASIAEGMGWADAERTLRKYITDQRPELAGPHARFHMFNTLDDVATAAENVDRVAQGRGPVAQAAIRTVGTATGAGAGFMLGGETGAGVGAAVGAILSPIIDAASQSGVTTQIGVARALAKVADAIRDRQPAAAQAAVINAAKTTGVKVAPSALSNAFSGLIKDETGSTKLFNFGRKQPSLFDADAAAVEAPAPAPPTPAPVTDASGRVIAPPQTELPPRPDGPWAQNAPVTPPPAPVPAPVTPPYREPAYPPSAGRGAYAQAVEGPPNIAGMTPAAAMAAKSSPAVAAGTAEFARAVASAKTDTALDAVLGAGKDDLSATDRAAYQALASRVTNKYIDPGTGRYMQTPDARTPGAQPGWSLQLGSYFLGKDLSKGEWTVLSKALNGITEGHNIDSTGAAGTTRRVVLPQSLDDVVGSLRDTLSGAPKGSWGLKLRRLVNSPDFGAFVDRAQGRTPQVNTIESAGQLSNGVMSSKSLDPRNIVGRALQMPDGSEIWRNEDGSIVSKDKTGASRSLTPDELKTVNRVAPWLTNGRLY